MHKLLPILVCLGLIGLCAQAEESTKVKYDGNWKWVTGKRSGRDPGKIRGDITKVNDELYQGSFISQRNAYNIKMKAEKIDTEILLSGTAWVSKRKYSMQGKLLEDGSLAATFSNGKDEGWLKLKPSKRQ